MVSVFVTFSATMLFRALRLKTVFDISDETNLSLWEINNIYCYLFPQGVTETLTSVEKLTRCVTFLKQELKHRNNVVVFLEATRHPATSDVTPSQLTGLIKTATIPNEHIIAKMRKGYSYSQIVDSVGIVDGWADRVFIGK